MGPIETRLRARLNFALGITFTEAYGIGGTLGRNILSRLVREGVAVQRTAGRYTLATHQPDVEALAAEEERGRQARLARIEAQRREQEALAARQRQREEAEAARRRQEAEQRLVMAGLAAYSQAERQLVLAERVAALRESRGGAA